ncbi:PPOX class F420-dependent oxidoreductase [Pseudonocardia sp. TRM90224]|uniref:PPOX class F420-dependent oxidoreductase n=1 Tax=Pseudonocardia sp. TRM90224 TaxID=2812678 RepID=UPI001E2C9627|nr:PPOX class F420-dependent oxidoreductase [Pseudonocardia sp. TRM90224]
MPSLPESARSLITNGALGHCVTLNPDGSPQVSAVWVDVEGDQLLMGHFAEYKKIKNLRRDPRIVLSFAGPEPLPNGMHPNLVVHGKAEVTEGGAAELITKLAKVYVGPDFDFPLPPGPPPGYVVRITVDRVGGVGPWISG